MFRPLPKERGPGGGLAFRPAQCGKPLLTPHINALPYSRRKVACVRGLRTENCGSLHNGILAYAGFTCLDACADRLAAIDMVEPLFFTATSATLIE